MDREDTNKSDNLPESESLYSSPKQFVGINIDSGRIISSPTVYLSKENLDVDIESDSWEITSVQVYTINGLPIFSANYSSDISDFDSSVVMQFYQTVQKFANNNLNTNLIDFKVANERIFFRVEGDNIFIIATRLGSHVRSGLNSSVYRDVSALITDIAALLSIDISNDETLQQFSLVEIISEIVQDVNDNVEVTPDDHVFVPDLDISYAVITDDTGMPHLSRVYDGSNYNNDPVLLSMFLHALNVFFNTNLSENLNEINFGDSRLYIQNYNEHFYAIMVKFQDYIDLREDSPISLLTFDLLANMVNLINDFDEEIKYVPQDSLELMVDSFIYKAKFRLNEEFRKKFE